jgi:hypothetical protein
MKTARRVRNPNRWRPSLSSNRAHGVVGQNRSGSFRGGSKATEFQPTGENFSLDFPSPETDPEADLSLRGDELQSEFGSSLLK